MEQVFFFFKQKTAYEIRPCDWSSDVCSSDLEPRALRGGDRERGVLHAERAEDVLLEVPVEPLAAHGLDHLAGPVDADPVLPPVAWIEHQRGRQRGVRAGRDPRRARGGLIPGDRGIPDL